MSNLDALVKIIQSIKHDFAVPDDLPKDIDPPVYISAETNVEPVVMKKDSVRIYAGTGTGREIAQKVYAESDKSLMSRGQKTIEVGFRDSIATAKTVVGPSADADEYDELFERFKRFAPEKDWQIIEDSLYVRRLSKARKNVSWYLEAIGNEYFSRGLNICKLIGAGYFEKYLESMYEFMTGPEGGLDIAGFNELYEEAVTQYPFAVFVSANRDRDDLKDEIKRKIAMNLSSEIHVINIHGLGKANGGTIRKILADEQIRKFYTAEPDVVESKNSIYARIFF